jgi:uncharacterized membrane protein (DUF2068 family)
MNDFENSDELLLTPAKTASHRDMIFVLLSLVLGFLFCEFILFGGLGISVPLFVIISYAVTLVYISKGKIIINKDVIITAIPIVLLCACFVLYDNQLLRFFNFLFLIFFSMLNLSYLTGVNEFHFFETGSFWDFIKAFFVFPFVNLDKSVKSISLSTKSSTKAAQILMAIAGVVVISPVAIIITILLMSSDASFQSLISDIFMNFKDLWTQNILKFIIAVILTFPIFSFLYSILHKNHNKELNTLKISKAVKIVDSLFVNSALWVICMIYVLYIFTELSYFFSAFFHTLPKGFTYSEYARRGFFELVAVTFINLILIIFSIAFTKRKEYKIKQSSRVTVFSLSILTIMIIATAVSKMVLYIEICGLTLLRFYTSWFMIVLLCIFVLLCVKMLNEKFKIMRVAAIIITILYIGLNFANVDALIPQYNIYKYEQNPSKGIDVTMFYELSSSMIPQAQKLANEPQFLNAKNNAANISNINKLLNERKSELKNSDWQNFNFSEYESLFFLNKQS